MKIKFYIQHLVIAILFLGFVPLKLSAINYTITFTGTGAGTTVDSVIVQNLTKGTTVTVPAGNILNLSDAKTAIEQINTPDKSILIYPSRVTGKYTVSFIANEAGVTQLNAYSIDGRKIEGSICNLQEGRNIFQVALPKGAFIIKINGSGFSYSSKLISYSSLETKPEISYTGNEQATSTIIQKSKNIGGVTYMFFTAGDQLLYKGYSANFNTIVTDIPTQNKTTNFEFVDSKEIPEYSYDKTKNFWDDTHWRWYQLRGKVKEMKVRRQEKWPSTYIYRFNNLGFLTSYVSSNADSLSLTYDNLNRISTTTSCDCVNSLVTSFNHDDMVSYTFTYGNHDKYYHIGDSYNRRTGFNHWPNTYWVSDTGGSSFYDPGDSYEEGIWVKGLTGIKSNQRYEKSFDISISSDSIRTKIDTYNNNYYTISSFYNGLFPNNELIVNKAFYPVGYWKSSLKFSDNGLPEKLVRDYYEQNNNNFVPYLSDSIEYVRDSPFHLYSTTQRGDEIHYFKYDKNGNLIENKYIDTRDNYTETASYFYISNDENGNWTQCIEILKTNYGSVEVYVSIINREISYW